METVKPIKETGLLSAQLYSPAADVEPNALGSRRSIYIHSAGIKLKLSIVGEASNSCSDFRVEKDQPLRGLEKAKETET